MDAVTVEGVGKTFRVPAEATHTLKERALHPFRRREHTALEALHDVSFTVPRGEFFGIVGRNGSGKSTLLKLMAGIYRADRGRIFVDGRLSSFIELGVGFNQDLPARDNVIVNATMLGLSPREARARLDEVIAFAELEEFAELKLKNYSSGMLVRLAFSVMVQVDADVLLIDEVLAVGDASFQQKCFDEFGRMRDAGATVLLVTHDMAAVERFCDRALLLEHGRTVMLGEPHPVGMRYLQLNFDRDERAAVAQDAGAAPDAGAASGQAPEETAAEPERYGDGRAEVVEAWFEDAGGTRATALPHGDPCAFAARVRFVEDVEDPLFGFVLEDGRRRTAFSASTLHSDPRPGRFAAGEEIVFRIRFDNVFAPDRYLATPAVAHAGTGIEWIDRRERFVAIQVTGTRPTDAVVDLPYDVVLER